jgi:hypothetical protein
MKYRPRKKLRGFCLVSIEVVVNKLFKKINLMRKQTEHKRFTMRNEYGSLPGCYWHAITIPSSVSISNQSNRIFIRPAQVCT